VDEIPSIALNDGVDWDQNHLTLNLAWILTVTVKSEGKIEALEVCVSLLGVFITLFQWVFAQFVSS
jgi:hypothetical protein